MRDQLFIVHSIISDVINSSNKKCIQIQSMDVICCYDKMDYFETHNNLWDVGVNDDKFTLIS